MAKIKATRESSQSKNNPITVYQGMEGRSMSGIWIRSQDREDLIFATQIKVCAEGDLIFAANDQRSAYVGRFKNSERCKEIINEIEDKLGYVNDTEIRTQVYHMPQS